MNDLCFGSFVDHAILFCVTFVARKSFTVSKIECFKQAVLRPVYFLWDNEIGFACYFVGLYTQVMIKRNSWGYSYLPARGEILGFGKDEQLRRHLSKMFSLIKNES